MWKVCWLLVIFSVYYTQCQFLSDYDYNSQRNLRPEDYLRHYWSWRSSTGPGSVWPPRGPERRDVDIDTPQGRDREPLGPDYQDPQPLPDAPGVDTGVIDVDSSGFPSGFPEIPDNSGYPSFGASFPSFFNFFSSFRAPKPWWNGPNICIEREETTEDKEETSSPDKPDDDEEDAADSFLSTINLSSCHETLEKYECVTKTSNRGVVKSFTVKYKCCYGYKRAKDSTGCTKVQLKNLLTTISDLEINEFKKLIVNAGLERQLKNNNYTVFVPLDKAISDFADKMVELNQVEVRRKRDLQNALSTGDLVSNHILSGFVDLSEIDNEQVFKTELKGSQVRLNIYPTSSGDRLITANCVPVRKANILTENGIVHVIDGVIPPSRETILEVIKQSKSLKMLQKIISHPKLASVLNRSDPFTFLAPTDAALNKLDKGYIDKLLNGDLCAVNILKYHIIPHSVCSSAINGNVTTHNTEGNVFNLERREDDSLIIDGKLAIETPDIVATNGVVHFVDNVFIPDSALHVMQIIKKYGFNKIHALIDNEQALVEEFNNMNATFLLPPDSSFTSEIVGKLEEAESTKPISSILKYHVIPGKIQSCDLSNNEMIETANGEKLRVNLYSTLPIFSNVVNRATINCARLVDLDKKTCGSVVHTLDRVLIPPKDNIYDTITKSDRYLILTKIIQGTEIEDILKNTSLSITFLALPDENFKDIKQNELQDIISDKKKVTELFKNHILTDVLCCSGVGATPWNFNNFVQTFARQTKEVRRNGRHQVLIGRTTVTKCDEMATNGVIHEVNKLMFPSKPTFSIPDFGLFLFNL